VRPSLTEAEEIFADQIRKAFFVASSTEDLSGYCDHRKFSKVTMAFTIARPASHS
jgi:hypothetical protein